MPVVSWNSDGSIYHWIDRWCIYFGVLLVSPMSYLLCTDVHSIIPLTQYTIEQYCICFSPSNMRDRYNPLHLIHPSDPFSQENKQDELFILLGNKKNGWQTNETLPPLDKLTKPKLCPISWICTPTCLSLGNNVLVRNNARNGRGCMREMVSGDSSNMIHSTVGADREILQYLQ